MKIYRAIIWIRDTDRPGIRVTIVADNLADALQKLEAEHGKGNVFTLHNEEEANRPR